MYNMQRGFRYSHNGFALPTVIIASFMMITMLLLSFQISRSTSNALQEQYYRQLASTAAEAGVMRATECLEASGGVQEWTSVKPLKAGTSCNGDPLSGCPGGAHCYVVYDGSTRTDFQVGEVTAGGAGGYNFTVKSSVDRVSPIDSVTRTVSVGSSNFVYGSSAKPSIAGGAGWDIYGHIGIFLSTSGQIYGYGQNNKGQIGVPNSPSIVQTPQLMPLPAGVNKVKFVQTSGVGASFVCIVGDDDAVYCRGDGVSLPNTGAWVKMNIPDGRPVLQITTNGYGDDSVCARTSANVYCAGSNSFGRLGNGSYTDVSLTGATRFMLPSGYTTPVKVLEMSLDANCVSATNGSNTKMYCAGAAYEGQISNIEDDDGVRIPIDFNIPNMGSVPRDVKDGVSTYHMESTSVHALSADGVIWSRGERDLGNFGSGSSLGATLMNTYPDWFGPRGGSISIGTQCLDVVGGTFGNSRPLQRYNCNGTAAQRFLYTADTGAIMLPNDSTSTTAYCLDLSGGNTADGSSVLLWSCIENTNQYWTIGADNTIRHTASGKCVNVTSSNRLELRNCATATNKTFVLSENAKPYLAMISGNNFLCGIRKSSARCSGVNSSGQLMNYQSSSNRDGNQCESTNSSWEVKLPAGETIDVDLLVSGSGEWKYQHKSLQVITRSGKVFGAGENIYGRLGNGSTAANQCQVVQMNLPPSVKAVDMSTSDEYSTYVLGSDGQVYAVGRNNVGQLGDGTTTNRSTPQRVKLKYDGLYF